MAQLARFQHRGDGIVHAEKLVVLPNDFNQPGLVFGKQGEVLHQIQQAARVACPPQHHFQRHSARLIFALDALPSDPTLPVGGQRTDQAVRAVGGNHECVKPKQPRNLLFVVRQVLVECRACRYPGLLQFDHHPGQSIDETH
ncbi:hypothetical protein D3C77_283290 [compost metagenome]